MNERRESVEFRIAGRTLSGRAMVYGTETTIAGVGREMFVAGAFGDLAGADVGLNLQHDAEHEIARTGAGLILSDGPAALELRAELREGSAELALIRRGALTALSVEFVARDERREGGTRIVERAELTGIGLVDTGAYAASKIELRQRGGQAAQFAKLQAKLSSEIGEAIAEATSGKIRTVTGTIPFEKKLSCGCHQGTCETVSFTPETFDESIDSGKEILVITDTFTKGLASKKRGSLKLKKTDEGLAIEAELADTEAARDLAAQAESMRILARPVFNDPEFVEGDDGVARYSRANLRAILLGATDADDGWPVAKIAEKPKRRARYWL